MKRREFVTLFAAFPLAMRWGEDKPSSITIVDGKEPGKKIAIHGTVYEKDGKTPAAGVKIFVYQTDAAGWYARPGNSPKQARLHGTVWTDKLGRYELRTVEPGHYADTNPPPPQHIHVHLQPTGLPDHWVESFMFDDDPRLREDHRRNNKEAGAFGFIVQLTKEKDGWFHGKRDFRIDPELAQKNRLVNGWYR